MVRSRVSSKNNRDIARNISRGAIIVCVVFFVCCFKATSLFADVSIKVVVANPSESERSVPIHYNLPNGLKKEDILSAGDLKVDYDVKEGSYYVYGQVQLAPKESKTLKIAVRDVWRISEEQIKDLEHILDEKLAVIQDPDKKEKAKLIASSLKDRLDTISKKQAELADDIERRMQFYAVTVNKLQEIKDRIFSLEKDVEFSEQKTDINDYGTIMLIIEAENVLNKEANMPIKYYLPKEIIPEYLIDKAGFDVKYDIDKGRFYLAKEEQFGPNETKRFRIQIKNVWTISEKILDSYVKEASMLNDKLASTELKEIGEALFSEIQRTADEIIESQQKDEPIKERIATYRTNQRKLDAIKADIEKLRTLFKEAKEREADASKLDKKKLKEVLEKIDYFKLQKLSNSVLKEKLKKVGVWRIISTIVLFTITLTIFFYTIWFLNLKKEEKRKLEKVKPKSVEEDAPEEKA